MSKRRNDYQSAKIAKEGLDKVIGIISKKINENRIPKNPLDVIALADQMRKEEEIFQKARRAEQEITNIRKARKERARYKKEADRAWRLYRREKFREKVRSIWQGIKDVHE